MLTSVRELLIRALMFCAIDQFERRGVIRGPNESNSQNRTFFPVTFSLRILAVSSQRACHHVVSTEWRRTHVKAVAQRCGARSRLDCLLCFRRQ